MKDLNTILFDLDGTLLPIDLPLFEKLYFEALGREFHNLLTPKDLATHIWASTKAMIQNTEYKTNEEVFMEDFAKRISGDITIYQEKFNNFYSTGFHSVRESVHSSAMMQKSISLLKEKGYTLVVATNPLFPKEAIYTRIQWAGVEPSDFYYISSFENNHYCKPQIYYYKEILEHIEKQPEECLMVGNDVQEDLIAGKLGMETYLIIDHMVHRTNNTIVPTYQGTYDDFYAFAESLPSVK